MLGAVLSFVGGGMGCILSAAPMSIWLADRAAAAEAPTLVSIMPSSGPAGAAYPLKATLRGTGFKSTGNIVHFGPAVISDLPSPDGTSITFSVPKLRGSRGEAPPAVLTPGEYAVTVETADGTSNALNFLLTAP